MKQPKIFLTSILAFIIIATMQSFKDYHINKERKEGKIIKQSLEEIDFEDIFTPKEEKEELKLEEPEVINTK